MSLAKGRRPDDFNVVFQEVCEIVVARIKEFVTQRQIMQVLSEEKLALIVVRKIQDHIYSRYNSNYIGIDSRESLCRKIKSSSTAVAALIAFFSGRRIWKNMDSIVNSL